MVRNADLVEQAMQLANARADLLGEIARVHLAGVSGSDQTKDKKQGEENG